MISWHPRAFDGSAAFYRDGWRTVDTMDVARLARCMARYVWSGCVWRGGVRRNANFHSSSWCVLDFESPSYTLRQALKDFGDCTHVIGTTKSHGTDKLGIGQAVDCFRVAVPWEGPITDLHTHAYNMGRMVHRYPIDPAARDGARLFFPCKEIISTAHGGYVQEVVAAPAPRPPTTLPPGVVTHFARFWLACGIPTGQRNALSFRVAKDLARAGFDSEAINSRLKGALLKNPLGDTELTALIASAMKAVNSESDYIKGVIA